MSKNSAVKWLVVVLCLGFGLLSGCGKTGNSGNNNDTRSVSQTIQAGTGGSLSLPNGATLTIPAGALPETTTITMSLLNLAANDLTQPIYRFEPAGLTLNTPASLRFPLTFDASNPDFGVRLYHQSDLHELLDYGSEVSDWHPILPSQIEEGFLTVELKHFSAMRAYWDQTQEDAYLVFDIPLKYLDAGDVLITLTHLRAENKFGLPVWVEPGPNWAPGHIGVLAPTEENQSRIIEASGKNVDIGEEIEFKTGEGHIYLDARRPTGGFSDAERGQMSEWLEAQIGKEYTTIGDIDPDDDAYSCASLAGSMLDHIGRGVPAGTGIDVIAPIDLYENLEPVRSISVPVGEEIEIPVYGVVVDPESAFKESGELDPGTVYVKYFHQYYCKGCNNTIETMNLPDGAAFTRKADGTYALTWVPQEEHEGQSFPIDFSMLATINYGQYSNERPDRTKTVEDVFTINVLPSAHLQLEVEGVGAVLSEPERLGLGCRTDNQAIEGKVCDKYFPLGTSLKLKTDQDFEHPDFANWTFVRYEGDCSGITCSLTMDEDKHVTAVFEKTKFALLIDDKAGQGTISSQPAGIDCGNDCLERFDIETSVTLTATPDLGWVFKSWAGDCSGANPTCTLMMDADKAVSAIFEIAVPQEFALAVVKEGDGDGTVTGTGGIDCGANCSSMLEAADNVTLSATPDADSIFFGWTATDQLCSGSGGCQFVMPAESVLVTATFFKIFFDFSIQEATLLSDDDGHACCIPPLFDVGDMLTLEVREFESVTLLAVGELVWNPTTGSYILETTDTVAGIAGVSLYYELTLVKVDGKITGFSLLEIIGENGALPDSNEDGFHSPMIIEYAAEVK